MRFIIVLLLCLPLCAVERYIDFDESMELAKFGIPEEQTRKVLGVKGSRVYDAFKNIYNKNNPSLMRPSKTTKIPRIIHHIWFGSKLQAGFTRFRQTWIDWHKDWTFIFWTDTGSNYDQGDVIVRTFTELERVLQEGNCKMIVVDIGQLQYPNRVCFETAKNYACRSDIFRYEIVNRYGGVYVDTDFECLNSLEKYHYHFDFYTGLQPLDTGIVQLGAALFGSCPNHPILQQCIAGIKENQDIKPIIMRTGPIHFTKSFLLKATSDNLYNIALPASYFYPCSFTQKGSGPSVWLKPESLAVHHWAASWIKPEAYIDKKMR